MADYPEPKNPLVFTSRREAHRFLIHPQLMMDTCTLWQTNIAMENHHVLWLNQL